MSSVNKPAHPRPEGVSISPAVRSLLQELNDFSGTEYFQKLADAFCETLGADIALVGEVIEDGAKMRTIAMTWDGEHRASITYDLDGTPCKNTVQRDYCLHRSGVQALYPSDEMLIDEKIEGYVGYPLYGEDGAALGAIIALSRRPIDVDGDIFDLAKVSAARARAELQHYQAQERLKETLSEALLLNYSKSMFMANISHELRNPLSAMIGYASLIRDRQVEAKNIQEYANEICLAGEELLALIGDILSLSSLEISGSSVEKQEFDLSEIARTGRRLLQEQAAAKNLSLLPVARSEPLYVLGDSKHTKKALLNLLSNSVKYTSFGEIEISVYCNDEGEAVLAVRDTGVGMSEKEIATAMQGMSDFNKAYNKHQDGGGLGLPLTHLLIERQGGRLEIESKKGAGSGTTIRLVFPCDCVTGAEGDFI